MSELRKPYIKLWAAETLLSDDMASLSDHDERVFWRLMMVASLEEERWITRETPGLHRKCVTTAPKFTRAIANLEAFGMVKRLDDGRLFVVNGKKWNEDTDRARYPSDSPERVKERVTRFRNGKRNEDVTSGNDSLQNDVTTPYRDRVREEKEKEEEDAPASGRAPRSPKLLSPPKKTKPTEEWADEMREKYPLRDFDETLRFHMNGSYYRGCADKCAFLEGKLKAASERERNNKVPPPRVITFDDDLPLPEGMALPEVRFQR